MAFSPLHIMITTAVGVDDWVVVSTIPDDLNFALNLNYIPQARAWCGSQELCALRAGAVRLTGLMRRDGESWSAAVRVPLSPHIFNSDHVVLREPFELVECLPGGGKVFFREFELAQHDAAGDAPPARIERRPIARMREVHNRLLASDPIYPTLSDTGKHGRVMAALGIRDDPPLYGYGIEAFVRQVLGKPWGKRSKPQS